MTRTKSVYLALLATLLSPMAANAVPIDVSFSGTFDQDDDVLLFSFVADGTSSITAISFGYAGGTQADGNVVSAGGFDPILTLFDSTGLIISVNDDDGCSSVNVGTDPNTNRRFDSCFESIISAGTYTLAISQYNNFALGSNLSDGFTQDGAGNFTADICGETGAFFDIGFGDCSQRTNAWAFDLLNVESATRVPEPSTLALLGIGLFGMGAARRRKKV